MMLSNNEMKTILADNDPLRLEMLLQEAETVRLQRHGNAIYLRGLIEFSNYCGLDCYYCGLRQSNQKINRYRLDKKTVIDLALSAYSKGFHSLALQSGENQSQAQVNYIVDIIKAIKDLTSRDGSQGLGITLSIGELDYISYKRIFEAGAHRYLLRVESSVPELFSKLHPARQTLASRLECLGYLREIGFQVGTGIMVGLPGQTADHLVEDIRFFIAEDIDMLGLGPYLINRDTPMAQSREPVIIDPYAATLKVMALVRILMPDINMVASTALQSLNPQGLQDAVRAGANVVMPVLTPEEIRRDYKIYENKRYKSLDDLEKEAAEIGYRISYWQWGDSKHYYKRINSDNYIYI